MASGCVICGAGYADGAQNRTGDRMNNGTPMGDYYQYVYYLAVGDTLTEDNGRASYICRITEGIVYFIVLPRTEGGHVFSLPLDKFKERTNKVSATLRLERERSIYQTGPTNK
jgi:hypothetical protein